MDKEKIDNKHRFIFSKKLNENYLEDLTIIHLDNNSNLIEKIIAERANISKSKWILNVMILKSDSDIFKESEFENQILAQFTIYKINNCLKILKTSLL